METHKGLRDLRLDKMAIRKGYLFRLRYGERPSYDTIVLKGNDFYYKNGDLKPIFWGYRLWRDVEREIDGKD